MQSIKQYNRVIISICIFQITCFCHSYKQKLNTINKITLCPKANTHHASQQDIRLDIYIAFSGNRIYKKKTCSHISLNFKIWFGKQHSNWRRINVQNIVMTVNVKNCALKDNSETSRQHNRIHSLKIIKNYVKLCIYKIYKSPLSNCPKLDKSSSCIYTEKFYLLRYNVTYHAEGQLMFRGKMFRAEE